MPRSAGACPYFYNHKFKSSGTPVARHFGSDYPFGHGLSYTGFDFSDLSLAQEAVDIETATIRTTSTLKISSDPPYRFETRKRTRVWDEIQAVTS